MKKVCFLILPFFIYSCSGPASSTKEVNHSKTQKQESVENKKEKEPELAVHPSKFRIVPVDQSSEDQSLQLFVSKLRNVVKQKDLNGLINCLDTGIVSSYGGGMYGIETFLKEWNLKQKPKESLFWNKMKVFLDLGGAWKDDKKTEFCFPYAQADRLYPKLDLDWYITAVCISPKTSIYEDADFNSKRIGLLSYEIVQILDRSEQFTKIKTIDKTVSGYASVNDLIHCASAYPVLEKTTGEWKITSFAPFD